MWRTTLDGGSCETSLQVCDIQGGRVDGGISLFMGLRWVQTFPRAWETSMRGLNAMNL